MQGYTPTLTPGASEADPTAERKYKENFHAAVSVSTNHSLGLV